MSDESDSSEKFSIQLDLDGGLIAALEEEAEAFGLSLSEFCTTALTAALIRSGRVKIIESDEINVTVSRLNG